MNTITDVSESNLLEFYEFEKDTPEILPVIDYTPGSGSNFLEYSELFRSRKTDEFTQKVERYKHDNPGFIIIKLVKKPNIEKIVFKRDEQILDTLYFYDVNALGIRVNDKIYEKWTVLRFEYDRSNGKTTKSFEDYIHEEDLNSHEDQINPINNGLLNKTLVTKNAVNNYYDSKITQIVNSNIITKDFQLFYMGNFIGNSKQFILDNHKSAGFDSLDTNYQVDMEYINKVLLDKNSMRLGE